MKMRRWSRVTDDALGMRRLSQRCQRLRYWSRSGTPPEPPAGSDHVDFTLEQGDQRHTVAGEPATRMQSVGGHGREHRLYIVGKHMVTLIHQRPGAR